uniref:Zona pellucida sperm-binding protein 3-like n=1 Tax=Sinocyclocheilus grahami TaxID=75366 RepID=A0A672M7H0_SINGR
AVCLHVNSTSALDGTFENDFDGSAVKSLGSPYLQLPVFQHSRIPLLDKKQFSPMHGSGREQLPEETKEVLVPRTAETVPEASRRRGRSQGVTVVCQMKKMIVKVHKHILGIDGLHSELKLGTCDISKTTKHYHVFIYDMDKCESKRKVCLANIFFSLNYFKPLRTVDSLWRRLSPTEEYTIGHPMYFQADGPPLAEDERLFVDSCYVTISSSHLSMPQFTVIENHGCMTDSKSSTWSKFIQSGQRNVVRFSLDAFLFHGMLGEHLYMHCEIAVGSFKPTSSAKSCTYNQSTKRWEELFGSNDACLCCDSTCLSSDLSGKKCQVILGQSMLLLEYISFHSTALRVNTIMLVKLSGKDEYACFWGMSEQSFRCLI